MINQKCLCNLPGLLSSLAPPRSIPPRLKRHWRCSNKRGWLNCGERWNAAGTSSAPPELPLSDELYPTFRSLIRKSILWSVEIHRRTLATSIRNMLIHIPSVAETIKLEKTKNEDKLKSFLVMKATTGKNFIWSCANIKWNLQYHGRKFCLSDYIWNGISQKRRTTKEDNHQHDYNT